MQNLMQCKTVANTNKIHIFIFFDYYTATVSLF